MIAAATADELHLLGGRQLDWFISMTGNDRAILLKAEEGPAQVGRRAAGAPVRRILIRHCDVIKDRRWYCGWATPAPSATAAGLT
jgi:hypothetical protein